MSDPTEDFIAGREQRAQRETHWTNLDTEAATALGENRFQAWVLDQDKVWRNIYGRERQLSDMDEDYLLAVVAFLHKNAGRFSMSWVLKANDPGCPEVRYDAERIRLAADDPHRFMATSRLMCGLWWNYFQRRGRLNGAGAEHVED